MAVYNGEAYLQEALDSILNQTFGNFEFIVVDDGSTDGSGAILAACSDPRLKVIRNDRNTGLSASLNRGLREAAGKYIVRLDADDLAEPERIARQVAWLDAHPDVALVGSWYHEVDEAGSITGVIDLPCEHIEILWALLFYTPFGHSALAFRREKVLSEVGYYDESLSHSMDHDLCFRIATRLKVANLPETLVRCRQHPQSISVTYGQQALEGYRMNVDIVSRLLGWSGDDPAQQQQRFDELFEFMRVPLAHSPPDRLKRMVTEIMRLQTAFGRHFGLSPSEAAAHRSRLRRWIAQRLRGMARGAAYRGDGREALRMIGLSYQADPRTVLASRSMKDLVRIGQGWRRGRRAAVTRRDAA